METFAFFTHKGDKLSINLLDGPNLPAEPPFDTLESQAAFVFGSELAQVLQKDSAAEEPCQKKLIQCCFVMNVFRFGRGTYTAWHTARLAEGGEVFAAWPRLLFRPTVLCRGRCLRSLSSCSSGGQVWFSNRLQRCNCCHVRCISFGYSEPRSHRQIAPGKAFSLHYTRCWLCRTSDAASKPGLAA